MKITANSLNNIIIIIAIIVASSVASVAQDKPATEEKRQELAGQLIMAEKIISLEAHLEEVSKKNAILEKNEKLYDLLVAEYEKQIKLYTNILEQKDRLNKLQQDILQTNIEELEKEVNKLRKKKGKSFFDFKTTASVVIGILIGGRLL